MDYFNLGNTSLHENFFAPIKQIYPQSSKQYDCTSISDLDFAKLGTLRCISHTTTGHEFIQHHGLETNDFYEVSHFFKALKSKRRLANLISINSLLNEHSKPLLPDAFAPVPELANFDIYAGDGHYQKASCFDKTIEGKKRATGHFFRLDLRSHHLDYISLEKRDLGKKKKHDATIIKEADPEALRNHAPKGRQVIYCWDKACIDYLQWSKLKHNNGIYFITQEKSNSAAEQMSNNLHDAADPRNEGVVTDCFVGTAGRMMRRIIYIDPRDGKRYTYITNELTLPAFALVLIYKIRWDEEKVFYQLKSKFHERKSWASSDTAKQAQAYFQCLAHNLALLIEEIIKQHENLEDEIEIKKKEGRSKHLKNREGEPLTANKNYINQIIERASHRTQRFIRWLRHQLYRQVPWSESMRLLKISWLKNPT
jgi:hypothetical protein